MYVVCHRDITLYYYCAKFQSNTIIIGVILLQLPLPFSHSAALKSTCWGEGAHMGHTVPKHRRGLPCSISFKTFLPVAERVRTWKL
jgi:hypothetical protein